MARPPDVSGGNLRGSCDCSVSANRMNVGYNRSRIRVSGLDRYLRLAQEISVQHLCNERALCVVSLLKLNFLTNRGHRRQRGNKDYM